MFSAAFQILFEAPNGPAFKGYFDNLCLAFRAIVTGWESRCLAHSSLRPLPLVQVVGDVDGVQRAGLEWPPFRVSLSRGPFPWGPLPVGLPSRAPLPRPLPRPCKGSPPGAAAPLPLLPPLTLRGGFPPRSVSLRPSSRRAKLHSVIFHLIFVSEIHTSNVDCYLRRLF